MNKLDAKSLLSKKQKVKLGGKTVHIGESSSVKSTPGGSAKQVLKALSEFGKINLPQTPYGATD